MNRYLLDSNVLIQAKNLHYGFDFCPAFWNWLDQQNKAGQVASLDKVRDEILQKEDALTNWACERRKTFFLSIDNQVASRFRLVSQWVKESEKYTDHAKRIFLGQADYYLVAYAKARNWTVVTHEVKANSESKIKIPNICEGLGIKCISPFKMLCDEKARFILCQSPEERARQYPQ